MRELVKHKDTFPQPDLKKMDIPSRALERRKLEHRTTLGSMKLVQQTISYRLDRLRSSLAV